MDLDGKVKAYLGTYVDDLIVAGPTEEVRSVLHEVETIWECSGSQILEKVGQELKLFCGFQVRRMSDIKETTSWTSVTRREWQVRRYGEEQFSKRQRMSSSILQH